MFPPCSFFLKTMCDGNLQQSWWSKTIYLSTIKTSNSWVMMRNICSCSSITKSWHYNKKKKSTHNFLLHRYLVSIRRSKNCRTNICQNVTFSRSNPFLAIGHSPSGLWTITWCTSAMTEAHINTVETNCLYAFSWNVFSMYVKVSRDLFTNWLYGLVIIEE